MKKLITSIFLLFTTQAFSAELCFKVSQKESLVIGSTVYNNAPYITIEILGDPHSEPLSLIPANLKTLNTITSSKIGETFCSDRVIYDGGNNLTVFNLRNK